jgi:thiamine-monophosphate kinase
MVAVTALGDLAGRAPVIRAGTRPGDVVVAAGRLGWASAGLRLLGEGQREGSLVDAYRRPAPPYRIAAELARLGASAMVDVSDGLLADLGHVADASGVRIDIELGRARSLAAPGVTDDDVLTGGDDHAIVAAIAHDTPLPDGVVMLGRVRPGSGVRVDGAARPGRAGHDHFREGRP